MNLKGRLEELAEKRQELLDGMTALIEKAESEDRDLTDEEAAEFSASKLEADQILNRYNRLNAVDGLEDGEKREVMPKSPTQEKKAPAQPKRYASLKNFDTDEEAYAAGQFIAAAIFDKEDAKLWCRENGIQLAQGSREASKGGVLVPDQFANRIIDLKERYGLFAREAFTVPMVRDKMTIPRRTGGLTVYSLGENPTADITDSDVEYDNVNLVLNGWATLTKMSRQLASWAIVNMGDQVMGEIAYAFASKEDDCGFNGDGGSTYQGITGVVNALAAGSIKTAASGNVSFETLDLDDYLAAVGALPTYVENPKWYISQYGWATSMQRLAHAAGGRTLVETERGMVKQFLGYDVEISQKLNSTAGSDTSAIKCLFGDLGMAAAMGVGPEMEIETSEHAGFARNQVWMRGIEYFDIVVHEVGTASAAGPIVAVKTAAS